jgi:hypothetical protein
MNGSYDMNILRNYNMSYVNLFNEKVSAYENIINKIKDAICDKKNVYIFGCHPTTQFLLNYKLQGITCIIDNDISKQNKILYGTELLCVSPNVIGTVENPIVICHMGPYTEEISNQLMKINKNTIII